MKRYFTTGHSFLGCFLHHRFQRAVTSSLSCHLSLLPFSPTPKSAIIFNQFSIACRRTGYMVLTSIFNRPIGTHWVAWSLPHLASLLPKTFPWYPIQTGWPSEFFFFNSTSHKIEPMPCPPDRQESILATRFLQFPRARCSQHNPASRGFKCRATMWAGKSTSKFLLQHSAITGCYC